MKKCFMCGRDLEDTANYCAYCGMYQPKPQTSNAPNSPEQAEEKAQTQTPFEEPTSGNQASQSANGMPYQGTYYADVPPQNPHGYAPQNPYNFGGYAAPPYVEPPHDNSLWEAYKLALKNYAVFSGRTRRRDYWFFSIMNSIIYAVFALVFYIGTFSSLASDSDAPMVWLVLSSVLMGGYSLAMMVPSFSIMVRRLHDTGKSAWYLLFLFLPYIGQIILFVFCCLDSTPGVNQYGPNPKGIQNFL